VRRDRAELRELAPIVCSGTSLSTRIGPATLRELFESAKTTEEWRSVEVELSALSITESAGGVNAGDRRAIFSLIRGLRPKSVLEVGTHIGASTVHVVAALRPDAHAADPPKMTTVDIVDVNDERTMPWRQLGSTYSPREMITRMDAVGWVRFITGRSLDYLANCPQTFDFIFLDGDHAAKTVYQEIPAALRLLNPGGVILLHDYFPNLRPLWSNGAVIHGPWLATERLRSEGAAIRVLPFGELPWPTKLNSRVSSLALVVGASV
jgi:SAM-dependent methyltransferase